LLLLLLLLLLLRPLPHLVADPLEVFDVQRPSKALPQHHLVLPHMLRQAPVAVDVTEIELTP
jgi:hypothetical protein